MIQWEKNACSRCRWKKFWWPIQKQSCVRVLQNRIPLDSASRVSSTWLVRRIALCMALYMAVRNSTLQLRVHNIYWMFFEPWLNVLRNQKDPLSSGFCWEKSSSFTGIGRQKRRVQQTNAVCVCGEGKSIGMGPSCHGVQLPPHHVHAQSEKSESLTWTSYVNMATSTATILIWERERERDTKLNLAFSICLLIGHICFLVIEDLRTVWFFCGRILTTD